MVNFCAVVGCSKRSNRDKDVRFYCIPGVITHQGQQTLELSKRRRELWLSRLHRDDLGPQKQRYARVCSKHFLTGKMRFISYVDVSKLLLLN